MSGSTPKANITLYFLQTSRAIRTAWLLEELGLDYKVEYFDREPTMDTPSSYREKSGFTSGRSPAIRDGNLSIIESAAIAEYLCETYDKTSRLMPADPATRAKVRTWMSAAEGTFFLHGLAIFYGSASVPDAAEGLQNGISGAVHRDFDWLEAELKQGGGKFLIGNSVTAADTMMEFTISFIMKNELGTKGKTWPAVEAWLKNVQSTEGYKRAVAKTGYKL